MHQQAACLRSQVVIFARPSLRTCQSSDGSARSLFSCTTSWTRRASWPPRRERGTYTPPFSRTSSGSTNGVVLVAEMGGEVLGSTYASVEDSDYIAVPRPAVTRSRSESSLITPPPFLPLS